MIEQGIFKLLLGDVSVNGVSTFTGPRIYPVFQKDLILPAIVFSIVSSGTIESLDGDNSTEIQRFQFDQYAKDYYTSRKMSRAVRSLLVPKSDHSGTAQSVSYSLADGTFIQAAHCHLDHDMGFEQGEGGYIYRSLLDIEFQYVEAPA